MTTRECGSCSLCCKVLDVPAMYKPAGKWCRNFAAGQGCTVHQLRPKSCRDFACLWLADALLDDAWKPSTSKFVMSLDYNDNALMIHVDHKAPNAWRADPYHAAIRKLAGNYLAENKLVMVVEPARRFVITPDQEIAVGHPSLFLAWEVTGSPSADGTLYNIEFDVVDDKAKGGATRFGALPDAPGAMPPPVQTRLDDTISFS